MAANNETGVLQPWREALDLCRCHGVPLACDAAQWIGKEPASGLGECDFVIGSAHKFGGPPGVGFLKAPPGRFQPLLVGGSPGGRTPRGDGEPAGGVGGGRRVGGAGTPIGRPGGRRSPALARRFHRRAPRRGSERRGVGREIGPAVEHRGRVDAPFFRLPPAMVVLLDKLGFAVSTGSACASGKEKPSHVLSAMGIDPSRSDRMLRFSAGWATAEADWRGLLEAVRSGRLRALPGQRRGGVMICPVGAEPSPGALRAGHFAG